MQSCRLGEMMNYGGLCPQEGSPGRRAADTVLTAECMRLCERKGEGGRGGADGTRRRKGWGSQKA